MIITLLIVLSLFFGGCSLNEEKVYSPDGNLSLSLNVNEGKASISLKYKSSILIDKSPIGIEFSDGYFGNDIKICSTENKSIDDSYTLYNGKSSQIQSKSNETHLFLENNSGRKVELFIRAFNDGVAYRFYIPEQEGMSQLAIRKEIMDLNIASNPVYKAMSLPGFTSSHENYFTTDTLSNIKDSILFDMPALFIYPTGQYMAITEANVVDYAGMYLTKENGILKGILSPRPDGSGLSVTGDLPRRSPWRVFQVSDTIGTILESNIVTTLADPCQEYDLSWLEPGLASWPWWNGYQAPSQLKKGNINEINQNLYRYYIDFCAENGIKYSSITGLLTEKGNEICWFYNENTPTGSPKDTDDTSRTYPGFDLDSLCRYAQEKGVQTRVWVHWKPLNKNIEETFRQFNKWGIKGMMVDYMDRDDEDMIAFQKKVLELAMKYHLHIQFHGASKPSGLNRTYPCELTRENTKNYECYKWGREYINDIIGSEHDLNIAFVRTLAGPADYHLGSFRAVKSELFIPDFQLPTTTSTRSHSLAMYIVLQSGLQLVSDSPEAYHNQEGFEFIKNVPTTWDETRVLLAEIDKYLVIARRKGDKWYIGGIGDSKPHDISIPLSFLGKGKFSETIYHDANDSDENLNNLERVETEVSSLDVINIHLMPNGGFAAYIYPIN